MSARRTTFNRLLHRLSADEAKQVASSTERIALLPGDTLCKAGAALRHVVFPDSGVVSLFARNAERVGLEVALVGVDGMFGAPLVVGVAVSSLEATVQGEGFAQRIEARRFRRLLALCPAFSARANRYLLRLAEEIAITAACNGFHSVEERTARWMLSMSDRMQSDTFAMTQSLLAEMIGVLRPAVSRAASALARDGLVTYSRGAVRIVDRRRLEHAACSCYSPPKGSAR